MSSVRLQCPNPDCQATFSISPNDASRFRRCPQCGTWLDGGPPTRGRSSDEGGASCGSMDLPVGTVFDGRYRIAKRLGVGGMGAVYLAFDKQLERNVALKVPVVPFKEGDEFLKRFLREARVAAKLHHPNLCAVHDVGMLNGQPYLTMAYLEGRPLSEVLKKRGVPFDQAEAARLVCALARALQKAHDFGITHRDLKPSNIMMTPGDVPIVMDFGLARRTDGDDSIRTATGQIIGTPAYMPLEQFRGDVQAIGPRTDVYSLGVILFQLLTGRQPYEGNLTTIYEKVLRARMPPLPSSLRPGLDRRLEAICLTAMGREPDDRYPSMTVFAAALEGWLAHRHMASEAAGPDESRYQGYVEAPEAPAEDAPDWLWPATLQHAPGWTDPRNRPFEPPAPLEDEPPAPQEAETSTPEGPARRAPRWVRALALLGSMGAMVGTAAQMAREGGEEKAVLDPKRVVGEVEKPSVPVVTATKPDVGPTVAVDVAAVAPAPAAERATGARTDAIKSAPLNGFEGTLAGQERDDNSLKLVLCWCPAGTFRMGSPLDEPQRDENEGPKEARLSRGYWLAKYEVTQEQYQRVTGAAPSSFSAGGDNREQVHGLDTSRFPVEHVSYSDALAFCRRLTEQERAAGRLPEDWEYRLPTEAQWEHGCRAGTTEATAFGDSLGSDQANFDGGYPYHGAKPGPYLERPTAVGSYGANRWGLCDMHGNVWEWCLDAHHENLPGGTDPFVGPTSAEDWLVLRGGSWNTSGWLCRSATRGRSTPGYQINDLGFRVAAVRL